MEQAAPRRVTSNRQERTSRDRSLNREVRWRLFKEEEMPARLRRLTRLERVARLDDSS
jgi:hypothetical protein